MPPKKKGGKKKLDDYWETEFSQDAEALGGTLSPADSAEASGRATPVRAADAAADDGEDDFMAQIAKAAYRTKNKKAKAASLAAGAEDLEARTAAAADEDDGTPRLKTKKEKEREKKERQKEERRLQAAKQAEKQAAAGAAGAAGVSPGPEPFVQPTPPPEEVSEPAEPASGGKKKKKEIGKGKRKGPDVAALQQMVEAQRAAEEEMRRKQEELERLEEERRKAEEEEERRKEEAKQRKKEKEKAKREQLRKEGKLLTKAQKEAQRQADIRRQQLLESGMITVAGLAEDQDQQKKRGMKTGGRKKKGAANRPEHAVKPDGRKDEQNSINEDAKPGDDVPVDSQPVEGQEETASAKESSEDSDEEPAIDLEGVKESWEMSSEDEEDTSKPAEKTNPAEKAKAAEKSKAADNTKHALTYATPHKPTAKSGAPQEPVANGNDKKDESESDESQEDSSEETDSGSNELTTAQKQAAQRKDEARKRREQRHKDAIASRSKDDLRSPICAILGHVDTGKTKLLDKIRETNVQEGEAGGITQQIGATYFPIDAVKAKTEGLNESFDFKIPGLLVIDTPGHESFTNLRSRGSSLCNIAILVVDIVHGLEPQTLESIRLLRDRKTPFVVALNKIDRLYDWKATPNRPFRESLAKQAKNVHKEFEDRVRQTIVAFAEQGLNAVLYYENKNFARNVSLVPTSAITGEGIPDLLMLLVNLTQTRMNDKLAYISELEATVLEVKVVEGLGTTIDVILCNGVIHEGDRIVVCGLNGPIVTNIRALLTPQPLRELRVKSAYIHHKSIKAAMGIKVCATDLEKAVAGSRLLVVGPDDDEEEMKDEIMSDLQDLMSSVDKSGQGVCVQASTLGSLEALLEFLRTSKIPVSGISIGPVHKRDIIRASTMLEKAKEYAVMLCFDVKIDKEAQELADELGIRLFKADIIYHLFDAFTAYKKDIEEQKRQDSAPQAVFPCVCKIIAIINKKDPIIVGVEVQEGTLRIGTPLAVVKASPTGERQVISLGKISSMEINRKAVEVVKKGQSGGGVAVKIEGSSYESSRVYGRHFDDSDLLYSRITRQSIDVLKQNFRDDLSKEEWALVIQLKKILGV